MENLNLLVPLAQVQWIVSLLGLVGIQGILVGATKRLDEKQADRYGAGKKYQEYLSTTNRWFPKIW